MTWEFQSLKLGSGPWLLPEVGPIAFQENLIRLVMNTYQWEEYATNSQVSFILQLCFASCWWLQICRLQHTCLLGSYISKGTLSLSCLKSHPSLIFLQRMGLPGDLVLMVLGCSVSRGRSLLSFSITGFLISQGPVSGQNRISSYKLLGLFFKIWPCPIITVCLWTSQESRASDLMAKTYLPTDTSENKAIFLKGILLSLLSEKPWEILFNLVSQEEKSGALCYPSHRLVIRMKNTVFKTRTLGKGSLPLFCFFPYWCFQGLSC